MRAIGALILLQCKSDHLSVSEYRRVDVFGQGQRELLDRLRGLELVEADQLLDAQQCAVGVELLQVAVHWDVQVSPEPVKVHPALDHTGVIKPRTPTPGVLLKEEVEVVQGHSTVGISSEHLWGVYADGADADSLDLHHGTALAVELGVTVTDDEQIIRPVDRDLQILGGLKTAARTLPWRGCHPPMATHATPPLAVQIAEEVDPALPLCVAVVSFLEDRGELHPDGALHELLHSTDTVERRSMAEVRPRQLADVQHVLAPGTFVR